MTKQILFRVELINGGDDQRCLPFKELVGEESGLENVLLCFQEGQWDFVQQFVERNLHQPSNAPPSKLKPREN